MKFFTFLFFFLFSFNTYAENIATIDFNKIFSESISYNNFLNKMNTYKETKMKEFQDIEKELLQEKDQIDEEKIILSNDEFNNKISIHQNNVREYQKKVDAINQEMFNKNENAKILIKNDVIKISQKIAIDNDITIIFDASNYVIAVKTIDLTEKIIEILNTNPNKLNIQ